MSEPGAMVKAKRTEDTTARLGNRGYSDPGVEHHRSLAGLYDDNADTVVVKAPLCNSAELERYRLKISSRTLLSSRVNARQKLRLPSFRALGIGAPHSSALLTPPDDDGVLPSLFPGSAATPHAVHPHGLSTPQECKGASLPSAALSKSPDVISQASTSGMSSSILSTSSTKSMETPTFAAEETGGAEVQIPPGSNIESGDDTEERPGWVAEAVDEAVAAVSVNRSGNVTTVMVHSQPCPLPGEIIEAFPKTEHVQIPKGSASTSVSDLLLKMQKRMNIQPSGTQAHEASTSALDPTTAFNDWMIELQKRDELRGTYIEIIHAVPNNFSLAQIPVSPRATPTTATNDADDYFSISGVFPKVVPVDDHDTAMLKTSPSSVRPIVPPASVCASILERFIPPPSLPEVVNVFSTEGPSVLMDRLWELREGGTLLFIYPTKTGGRTFSARYLSPILGPVLRSMIGIHDLSHDVGQTLGSMASIDRLLSFEQMEAKIGALLRRLGHAKTKPVPTTSMTPINSSSSSSTTTTTTANNITTTRSSRLAFAMIHRQRRIVNLDHRSWVEWWILQESSRIRGFFDEYYTRGRRLPCSDRMTAANLYWELVDGIKGRGYAEYDEPRDGVEVGCFVIKRTA